MPTCMHCSPTVLALILLYGIVITSLARLPSEVTCSFPHHVRLPVSHNNAPQHNTMFPDSIIAA